MAIEFKLPDLGEGIHEGEIVEVLVKVGDRVEDGQPILMVETDKATTEVPSPVTGTVKEIRVKAGDTVKVGDVLMTFEAEGASAEPKAKETVEGGEKPETTPEKREEQRAAQTEKAEATAQKTETPAPEGKPPEERKPSPPPERGEGPVPAAPSTRRLARELGVDLGQVTPSGPAGRVTAEDVRAFAEQAKRGPEAPEAPKGVPERKPEEARPQAPPTPPPLPAFDQLGRIERIPLKSVRRATAHHMALAWSQIPHVTHQDVADVTEIEAFRKKHKDEIKTQGGSLSMTVFVLKAAVAALKKFPSFNSTIDMAAEEIIVKRYFNIGVAADTERGLIVPVVKDADRKSITELSKELFELAKKTREGKASAEDMSGGTFTITNIGMLGGTGFTPIVNYPQVAILGMAQARLQPVVQGTEQNFRIVPRLLMPLVVAFDHRVVDGADAARFLNVIIEALQDPEKLLMEI